LPLERLLSTLFTSSSLRNSSETMSAALANSSLEPPVRTASSPSWGGPFERI
jgi:hypothetical protein